jgi:hypothetical protein
MNESTVRLRHHGYRLCCGDRSSCKLHQFDYVVVELLGQGFTRVTSVHDSSTLPRTTRLAVGCNSAPKDPGIA